MKSKSFLILAAATALVVLFLREAQADRYATLTNGDSFTITEGETALVQFSTRQSVLYQPEGGSAVNIWASSIGSTPSELAQVSPSNPLPLVGPATISFDTGVDLGVAAFRIVSTEIPSDPPTPPSGTPSTAVVIPSDATGPVEIILESSTDLITWTAANPGTYGASTTNRFFRVLAVNQ